MESTLEFLRRKLKEAGPERWPEIVERTGIAKTLPRKLAYGDRLNPGVRTVQPLIDFFIEEERATRAHHDTGERRRITDGVALGGA